MWAPPDTSLRFFPLFFLGDLGVATFFAVFVIFVVSSGKAMPAQLPDVALRLVTSSNAASVLASASEDALVGS